MSKGKKDVMMEDGKGPDSPTKQNIVKAIVVGIREDVRAEMSGKTRQIDDSEDWTTMYKDGKAISPPFEPLILAQLPENSSELGQCIEAMEVNIEGFGHRFVPIVDSTEIKEAQKKEMEKEHVELFNFFNTCSGVEESFTQLRRKTRKDMEATGNGYWEIIEPPLKKNSLSGINHIEAHTMRLSTLDKEFVDVEEKRLIKKDDGTWKYEEVKVQRKFRKFCQIRGGSTVWFKSLNDPRDLNYKTGEFAKDGARLKVEDRANSVIHFKIYSPRSPYGIPRYIGNLFSIYGSRASEEINYTTLRNNNIPSMIVAVSNGQLTSGTIKRMKEFVETQIKGSDNYSKFLLLEAMPVEEGDAGDGKVKIEVKELTGSQMHDAFFQTYDKNNCEKVRRSFRLPPIFLGGADEYNRATADTSRKLADEQIFAPERDEIDFVINRQILPKLSARYYVFKSNSPIITNNEELIRLLTAAERAGGINPQIARDIISEIFGKDMGKVTAIDPKIPFTIQVAEAAKKRSPINLGTVAPIKSDVDYSDVQEFIMGLLAVRKILTSYSEYGGKIEGE